MNQLKQKSNKKASAHLCKRCKENERVTLYYCQPCREAHNKSTRELKRRYRASSQCVDCGNLSNGKRYCQLCKQKYVVWTSRCLQRNRAKQGFFGKLEQISEVI